MPRHAPRSNLFPYTTLFRSIAAAWGVVLAARHDLPHLDEAFALIRAARPTDRKSTRLNSSHVEISYAVFCLKKKNIYPQEVRSWDVHTSGYAVRGRQLSPAV